MVARIYKPSKTAMQSGMAQTKKWVLELEYDMAKSIEPLMGWTGSSDTNSQVQLWFESKEVAINYAKKKGYHILFSMLTLENISLGKMDMVTILHIIKKYHGHINFVKLHRIW